MYFGQFCLTELNRTKKAFCPDLFLTIQIPSLRVSAMGWRNGWHMLSTPRQVNRPQNAPSLNTKCENTKVGKYRNGPHICHIQWNILNQPQNIIKSQKGNFLRPNQNSLHTDTKYVYEILNSRNGRNMLHPFRKINHTWYSQPQNTPTPDFLSEGWVSKYLQKSDKGDLMCLEIDFPKTNFSNSNCFTVIVPSDCGLLPIAGWHVCSFYLICRWGKKQDLEGELLWGLSGSKKAKYSQFTRTLLHPINLHNNKFQNKFKNSIWTGLQKGKLFGVHPELLQ